MKDGMTSTEIVATDVTATNLSGTNFAGGAGEVGAAEIGNNVITNAQMATNGASGTTVGLEFATVKTGSPSAGGNSIQFGTDTAAGEAKWIVFGTAFAAAPVVTLSPAFSGTIAATHAYLGTVAVGSFSWIGNPSGTNSTFHWQACGSGRV